MKEIIYKESTSADPTRTLSCRHELMGLEQAVKEGEYKGFQGLEGRPKNEDIEIVLEDGFIKSAPNLTLNISEAVASDTERGILAALGFLTQASAIVIWVLTTHHWKLGRAGKVTPAYGLPCAISGAVMGFVGLLLCAHAVEDVTTERSYRPKTGPSSSQPDPVYKVVRIQKACTAGSQRFGSLMIHNSPGDPCLRMSRCLNTGEPLVIHKLYTLFGTLLSISGFLLQFFGLRTLHISATGVQLLTMVIMTGVRAFLSRGVVKAPTWGSLKEGHELSDAALKLNGCEEFGILTTLTASRSQSSKLDSQDLPRPNIKIVATTEPADVSTHELNEKAEFNSAQVYRVIRMRAELGIVTAWPEECSAWGPIVAKAIHNVFEEVRRLSSDEQLTLREMSFGRGWQLQTYLQCSGSECYNKCDIFIDPDELAAQSEQRASGADENRIALCGEIYSAILCLWYSALERHIDRTSSSLTRSFARVVGYQTKGTDDPNNVDGWLRTKTWPVRRDVDLEETTDRSIDKDGNEKAFHPTLRFGTQFSYPSWPNEE